MKKILIIGGGGVLFITIIAAALLSNQPSDEPQKAPATTVTSSTTTTATEEETTSSTEDKSEKSSADNPKGDTTQKAPQANVKPSYQNFSRDAFNKETGTSKVLFFYNKDHAPSAKLDALLKAHIAEFPKNTTVFKVLYNSERDLAKSTSVTSPGTALRYNAKNNLVGIYLANDAPDIATFRAALQLDDKP